MSNIADKTEQPTPRRRRQARREGQVARSAELPVAASLLALSAVAAVGAARAGRILVEQTSFLLASADQGLQAPIWPAVRPVLTAVTAPVMFAALGAGVAAYVAQGGVQFAPKSQRPGLRHLSPKKALERFRPSIMGWELARSMIKLGLLAVVVWEPLAQTTKRLLAAGDLVDALAVAAQGLWSLLLRASLLAALVAGADYAVNRVRHQRKLRMSRRELKEELRQMEGDPQVRQQLRRRQQELSRNRMIREVATATAVVTNPTRLAVALRYRPPEPAPRVVAKGAGRMASRIKREAFRNGVPVVEDRVLARALYRRTRVGSYIPAALYEAAAVVLAVAYRRTGRRVA